MEVIKKRQGVLLCVTAPFFILDTVVCARITQEIWDHIPMDGNAMVFWCILAAVYLVLFRAAIGLFYRSCAALIKGISNEMRIHVYEYAVDQKLWFRDDASVSSVLNNDIPLLENDYYRAWIMLLTKSFEILIACTTAFSENALYGSICFLIMLLPMVLSKKSAVRVGEDNCKIQKIKKEYLDFITCLGQGKETIRHYQMVDVVWGLHGGIARQLAAGNTSKMDELSKSMVISQNMNRCASGMVALIGFYLAGKGVISLGWVMAFIQLSSSMTYTLAEVVQEGMKIYGSRPVRQKLFQEYDFRLHRNRI